MEWFFIAVALVTACLWLSGHKWTATIFAVGVLTALHTASELVDAARVFQETGDFHIWAVNTMSALEPAALFLIAASAIIWIGTSLGSLKRGRR